MWIDEFYLLHVLLKTASALPVGYFHSCVTHVSHYVDVFNTTELYCQSDTCLTNEMILLTYASAGLFLCSEKNKNVYMVFPTFVVLRKQNRDVYSGMI